MLPWTQVESNKSACLLLLLHNQIGEVGYWMLNEDLPEPQKAFCKHDFAEHEYMHIDPWTFY
jgi:hypothetical protein